MPKTTRRHKGRYIEVPDDVWNAVAARAAECGRSRTAEVIAALRWWLEREPEAAVRPKGRKPHSSA